MVAILLLVGALQAVEQDNPVVTTFEMSREKVEQKVCVSMVVKNPAARDLTDVWVSIAYFDGERELRQSKPTRIARVAMRESAPVALTARQVEKFSRYEVSLESEGRRWLYAGAPSDELPKFKKVEKLPARTLETRPTAEVRGLKWFNWDPLDNRRDELKDIPFLRLAIRHKGETLHATGKIQIMLFDGSKPLKYLNIPIDDGSYGRDADELNTKTALPEAVAFEVTAGEVWIGLQRMDHAKCALRVDVTLILDDLGTWKWTGLEKTIAAEPRPADGK